MTQASAAGYLVTTKQLFLSKANKAYLSKWFHIYHKNDGGKLDAKRFVETVPLLMGSWKRLAVVDSYESVDGDQLAELQYLNKDFIREHGYAWRAGEVYDLPKNYKWSVDDYRNMDSSKPADVVVSDRDYRWGNRPRKLVQALHSRNLDRTNEGMSGGRSLVATTDSAYDMTEYYKTVDKSYSTENTLDSGPTYDSFYDSSINLL